MDRHRPDFSKYDEDVVLNDARYTTDTPRDLGGPFAMCSMCFSDQVVAHPFLPNFKLMNCHKYEGATDPVIWICDYILAVQVPNRDDLHAIKQLSLMLKGLTPHWLHALKPGSINTCADIHAEFMANIRGTYVRPADSSDLAIMKKRKNESVHDYWTRFLKKKRTKSSNATTRRQSMHSKTTSTMSSFQGTSATTS